MRYDGLEYISYDEIGNPVYYFNSSPTDAYTFTWDGRKLTSGSYNDSNFSYSYNIDGINDRSKCCLL